MDIAEIRATLLQEAMQALIDQGLPAEAAATFADIIVGEHPVSRGIIPSDKALISRATYWVVRDDDVKLIDGLWNALTAAAGTNYFVGSVTAAAVTGVVAAVAKTIYNMRRKGAYLNPLQHRLLLALRSVQGLLETELLERIQTMHAPDEPKLTVADLNTELMALTKVRLRDGTVVALVAQDGDQRWSVCGV